MLQTAAFTDLRNYIKKRIAKAQYRVGSTWYDAPIVDASITPDNVVRIKSEITHGAPCTITAVQLVNSDQQVWATKAVSIVIESASTHLMQWFDFSVTESEVS